MINTTREVEEVINREAGSKEGRQNCQVSKPHLLLSSWMKCGYVCSYKL
jgi:hypothetical protein